jgi:hypothetical protein
MKALGLFEVSAVSGGRTGFQNSLDFNILWIPRSSDALFDNVLYFLYLVVCIYFMITCYHPHKAKT